MYSIIKSVFIVYSVFSFCSLILAEKLFLALLPAAVTVSTVGLSLISRLSQEHIGLELLSQ